MTTGWEKHEPSPIEYMHGQLMKEFHNWRTGITKDTTVSINGADLSLLIAKAKKSTYEKYKVLRLDESILKTDLKATKNPTP